MAEALHEIEIKRVYPATPSGTAILLGNDEKSFLVFIGPHEAEALLRAMKDESLPRPMTHDLLQNVLLGFDLSIKKFIISDMVDNAYCATLILEQKVLEGDGSWAGRRNEVRIDARPSDCMVLAVKNGVPILVTDRVLVQVPDFSHLLKDDDGPDALFDAGRAETDSPFGDPGEASGPGDEDESESSEFGFEVGDDDDDDEDDREAGARDP